MRTGKQIPKKMPIFRLSEKALEMKPTIVGPPEQPRSPAKAKNANMSVPPRRRTADALLNVPGHMIPTESPHNAQPIRLITGFGTSEIRR